MEYDYIPLLKFLPWFFGFNALVIFLGWIWHGPHAKKANIERLISSLDVPGNKWKGMEGYVASSDVRRLKELGCEITGTHIDPNYPPFNNNSISFKTPGGRNAVFKNLDHGRGADVGLF